MLDYETIFLPQRDTEVLYAISSGKVLTLHEADAEYLLSLGFIARYAFSNNNNQYVVTPKGMRYKEFLDQKTRILNQQKANQDAEQLKNDKKEKYDRRITIASIVISNIIAIAAIIISILK